MLAENLKKIMQLRQFSQRDLARLSGVSQVNISRILAGRHQPGFGQIEKIAQALHISIDELINNKFRREQKNTGQRSRLSAKLEKLIETLPEDDSLLVFLEKLIDRELNKSS